MVSVKTSATAAVRVSDVCSSCNRDGPLVNLKLRIGSLPSTMTPTSPPTLEESLTYPEILLGMLKRR